MSWYGLVTFCAAYFLAVATPGPGVAAVVAQGLARGSRGAPAFIGGFILGDLTWFFAAALGLSALAQTAHAAFLAVKYAGAVYLLYLAYRLWSAPVQPVTVSVGQDTAQKPLKLFLGSLALTLGNPKVMIFFMALLPSVVPLESLNWHGQLSIAAAIVIIQPAVLGGYVLIAARAYLVSQSAGRQNRQPKQRHHDGCRCRCRGDSLEHLRTCSILPHDNGGSDV